MGDTLLSAHGIYRRLASDLISKNLRELSSLDNAIHIAGQSIGRRALEHDNDGKMTRDGGVASVPPITTLDLNVPSTMIHCSICGIWQQSGCNGTFLRVKPVGRGKTRRRRASRQKGFALARKKAVSLSGGKKWNDEDNLNGQAKTTFNGVNNGSCRNAIVISCGACGARRKTTGLAPINIQTKKKVDVTQLRTTKLDTTHRPPAENRERQDCNLAGLNFVPLSSNKSKNSTMQLHHSMLVNPLGGGKISKAKKGQKKPKSGLLDFLSSLND